MYKGYFKDSEVKIRTIKTNLIFNYILFILYLFLFSYLSSVYFNFKKINNTIIVDFCFCILKFVLLFDGVDEFKRGFN